MLIIWKFPKSIVGRTKGPRRLHAGCVFETPAVDSSLTFSVLFLLLCYFNILILFMELCLFIVNSVLESCTGWVNPHRLRVAAFASRVQEPALLYMRVELRAGRVVHGTGTGAG